MVTFWQLTSCIRRMSGMVCCFAVPKVDIDTNAALETRRA
jgi:hypothetical protein